MSDDTYEIYAVRYAHHDRKAPENYIGGDPHDILQPLDYFVWAIKGAQRTYVVDTGFDAAVVVLRVICSRPVAMAVAIARRVPSGSVSVSN